jgi:hypothetical protein
MQSSSTQSIYAQVAALFVELTKSKRQLDFGPQNEPGQTTNGPTVP